MQHEDQDTSRTARTRAPGARARRPVPTAHRVAAVLGLALTLAVGVATVTVTLHEAGDRTSAPAVTTPAPPDPRLMRLWGLRPAPDGVLSPVATSDPVARTAIEQLYADLLRPPTR